MMQEFLEEARKLDHRWLELKVIASNIAAQKVYLKNGFKITRPDEYILTMGRYL